MKRSIIILSIAIILFAGCTDKKEDDHSAIHQHDDGSVHQNHEEKNEIKQEEFIVPVDTALQKVDSMHEHTHDEHGHPHKH